MNIDINPLIVNGYKINSLSKGSTYFTERGLDENLVPSEIEHYFPGKKSNCKLMLHNGVWYEALSTDRVYS